MIEFVFKALSYIWPVVNVMFICAVLVSPLAALKRARGSVAAFMTAFSAVLGVTTWLWSFGVTLVLWGWWAVIVGVVLLGVGIVPVALVAATFEGEWTVFWQMIVAIAFVFGTRMFAAYLAERL